MYPHPFWNFSIVVLLLTRGGGGVSQRRTSERGVDNYRHISRRLEAIWKRPSNVWAGLICPSPSTTTTASITRMESIKRQLLTGHRPRNLRIDATALELVTRKTSRSDMVSEHGNWPHAACHMPHGKALAQQLQRPLEPMGRHNWQLRQQFTWPHQQLSFCVPSPPLCIYAFYYSLFPFCSCSCLLCNCFAFAYKTFSCSHTLWHPFPLRLLLAFPLHTLAMKLLPSGSWPRLKWPT